MPKWALIFGIVLVLLGLLGYFGAPATPPEANRENLQAPSGDRSGLDPGAKDAPTKSVTALIPAAFGMLLVLCGTLGLIPNLRKHAMHAAAAVALLGVLAAGGRLASGIDKLLEGDFSRTTLFLMGMTVICGLYVYLSVQSFRQARKARQAETVQ
jgi:hypothetical protein